MRCRLSNRTIHGPGRIQSIAFVSVFAIIPSYCRRPGHAGSRIIAVFRERRGQTTKTKLQPNGLHPIGMVRDTELAPDQVTNPTQGPAIGLESGLEGALAEDPQDAAPLRGRQPRRSSRPGSAAKGFQARGPMVAQLLGPLPNGPEADAKSSGDRGMSEATGSEKSSSLQPPFFDLALSQFARAPHHRYDARTRAGEEATYLKLNSRT